MEPVFESGKSVISFNHINRTAEFQPVKFLSIDCSVLTFRIKQFFSQTGFEYLIAYAIAYCNQSFIFRTVNRLDLTGFTDLAFIISFQNLADNFYNFIIAGEPIPKVFKDILSRSSRIFEIITEIKTCVNFHNSCSCFMRFSASILSAILSAMCVIRSANLSVPSLSTL